ncbi:MAG: DNA repair protein RadA [Gammaproteobacteria bacterium]|nr:DNA repair protein RadA [Gammaproteobacteria bacterium]
MSKMKQAYVCQHCGAIHNKWAGQCGDCQEWNSLVEELLPAVSKSSPRQQGYAGVSDSEVVSLANVGLQENMRLSTGFSELDRVLGGGLTVGSVVLLGGAPGIGKSTLLLAALCNLSQHQKVFYVTGEESLQQVSLRAHRLGLSQHELLLLAETDVEKILQKSKTLRPNIIVIDSIQTLFSADLSAAPGSVSQVRESAAKLVGYAKQNQVALFLVGHVTKEGSIAGPRVLEHMVDCVLYFEGANDSRFRILRAIKNRFGAVNELGVFAMMDTGLKEVSNPSAIFLANHDIPSPGSVIMATWEGSRPLLVEMQVLVDASSAPNVRRVCVGIDNNRLLMLLAVLHKHLGVVLYDQDVYLNIVGGFRVSETGADLAVILAAISSLKNAIVSREWIVFGEVGLSGEVRPVQGGQERIKEAAKQGFKHAIVPKGNVAGARFAEGIKIHAISHLSELQTILHDEKILTNQR